MNKLEADRTACRAASYRIWTILFRALSDTVETTNRPSSALDDPISNANGDVECLEETQRYCIGTTSLASTVPPFSAPGNAKTHISLNTRSLRESTSLPVDHIFTGALNSGSSRPPAVALNSSGSDTVTLLSIREVPRNDAAMIASIHVDLSSSLAAHIQYVLLPCSGVTPNECSRLVIWSPSTMTEHSPKPMMPAAWPVDTLSFQYDIWPRLNCERLITAGRKVLDLTVQDNEIPPLPVLNFAAPLDQIPFYGGVGK